MTRAEKIFSLKLRYHQHMLHRRYKAAERVWLKLFALMNLQLDWENKTI